MQRPLGSGLRARDTDREDRMSHFVFADKSGNDYKGFVDHYTGYWFASPELPEGTHSPRDFPGFIGRHFYYDTTPSRYLIPGYNFNVLESNPVIWAKYVSGANLEYFGFEYLEGRSTCTYNTALREPEYFKFAAYSDEGKLELRHQPSFASDPMVAPVTTKSSPTFIHHLQIRRDLISTYVDDVTVCEWRTCRNTTGYIPSLLLVDEGHTVDLDDTLYLLNKMGVLETATWPIVALASANITSAYQIQWATGYNPDWAANGEHPYTKSVVKVLNTHLTSGPECFSNDKYVHIYRGANPTINT